MEKIQRQSIAHHLTIDATSGMVLSEAALRAYICCMCMMHGMMKLDEGKMLDVIYFEIQKAFNTVHYTSTAQV